MANREEKRTQRQKRMARGVERRAATAERRAAMTERSERRDREAREKLEPLEHAERPTVVTISAVIAVVIGAGTLIAYLAGATYHGDRPPVVNVIWPVFLMGMAAYGMWRARYWAVLGFDVFLVFVMIVAFIGLIAAKSVLGAVVFVAVLAGAGTLFFFMVKAMARIQMPERRAPGAR
jgi:hypothetical protein